MPVDGLPRRVAPGARLPVPEAFADPEPPAAAGLPRVGVGPLAALLLAALEPLAALLLATPGLLAALPLATPEPVAALPLAAPRPLDAPPLDALLAAPGPRAAREPLDVLPLAAPPPAAVGLVDRRMYPLTLPTPAAPPPEPTDAPPPATAADAPPDPPPSKSPLLECHTALASAFVLGGNMKGFGARPLPAAISSMERPEATERSSASKAS